MLPALMLAENMNIPFGQEQKLHSKSTPDQKN